MKSYREQKVVVTGGAGFIGSHLVKALLDQNAFVTVLDDFSTGSKKNLPQHVNLEIVRGSVSHADVVQKTIQDSSYVFHQAARNILVSLSDPMDDCKTNILGTLCILMAVKQSSSVKRLVYASTDSVYGNSRYLPINEEDSPNTLSPYAASKLAGENYCKAFYESFGVSTTILRYSNVYGPSQKSKSLNFKVIDHFMECALAGNSLSVHGDGEQTRDFIFVEDAVEATLLAAVSSKAEGQIYNVGSGFETTIVHLAQKITQLTGSGASIRFIDRKDIDNIRRRSVNIEKIRKDLHWTPKHTLELGLKKTILGYRQRESGPG